MNTHEHIPQKRPSWLPATHLTWQIYTLPLSPNAFPNPLRIAKTKPKLFCKTTAHHHTLLCQATSLPKVLPYLKTYPLLTWRDRSTPYIWFLCFFFFKKTFVLNMLSIEVFFLSLDFLLLSFWFPLTSFCFKLSQFLFEFNLFPLFLLSMVFLWHFNCFCVIFNSINVLLFQSFSFAFQSISLTTMCVCFSSFFLFFYLL